MGVLQRSLGMNTTDYDPIAHSVFNVGVDDHGTGHPPVFGFLELLDDGTAFLLLDDNTDFLLLG